MKIATFNINNVNRRLPNLLAWLRAAKPDAVAHVAKLLKQDLPVVLAGDYNVAPTGIDIYPTKSWDKDALIQPKSRAVSRRKASAASRWKWRVAGYAIEA